MESPVREMVKMALNFSFSTFKKETFTKEKSFLSTGSFFRKKVY
jgi:hypothetical protein